MHRPGSASHFGQERPDDYSACLVQLNSILNRIVFPESACFLSLSRYDAIRMTTRSLQHAESQSCIRFQSAARRRGGTVPGKDA